MDLSPMNLQVMIPRSNDASQVQHNLNQQTAVQQDFEMIRQKADDALKQKQVRAREEMEDGKIKDDQDHKKKQGQGKNGQAKHKVQSMAPEQAKEKMAVDVFRGHNIDIKL
ncbi:MAG: hypothetical protein WCS30_06670 [Selenomonadaceae bacterium]